MTDSDFVVVHVAGSFHEAKILAGFLESEGIRARVPGSELADEFGMAQKMAGTAEVGVMRKDLEKAQDIVAAWVDRGAGEAPPKGSGENGR